MLSFEFPYTDQQRKSFFSGKLITEWAKKYPFLFDKDDIKLARSQAPKFHYHFYEWLGAVLLYEATGYYSLIAGKDKFNRIMVDSAGTPDLLVYSPDKKDWFFCEAKGPRDKLRPNQIAKFRELSKLTGKDVCLIKFYRI
jgi:hypothetical protein